MTVPVVTNTVPPMPNSSDTYSAPIRISEAARLLGVHRDTIRRWVEEGKLNAVRLPGGEVRYRREDIVGMLEVRG